MLFLLRCVLWLSLVYAAILFPHNVKPNVTAPRAAEASLAQVATSKVAATVSDYCKGRAPQCLNDAARLTSLISTASVAMSAEPAPVDAKRRTASARTSRDSIAAILGRNP